MANNNNEEEPENAPEPNRWYNISLGPSFKDQQNPSPKFCLLSYKFKPASVDKSKPGLFHKAKDNRVKVEFENNQHGKPKVAFECDNDDYKDNHAVLFFDGETFQLQRLHREFNKLKHLRRSSESNAADSKAIGPSVGPAAEGYSPTDPPPLKRARSESLNKVHFPSLPLEVERSNTGDFCSGESRKKKNTEYPPSHPNQPPYNLPHQAEADGKIADVDVSDDEEHKMGHNAADALRAQVNAEGKKQSSSFSSSSGSESSRSRSGSSNDSESDADSLISI